MTQGKRKPATARRRAREKAVQALYQWVITGDSLSSIENQFLEAHLHEEHGPVDRDFFFDIVRGVAANAPALDALLVERLDRPGEQLDPIEKCILRLGAYELRDRLEVPKKVVINEAVELAKRFGAEQSHRYVNGVLDKLAYELRPHG